MRTARQLIAVDFRTGKRVWEELSSRDNSFERLMAPGFKPSRRNSSSPLAALLKQRLWGNVPYGTLSSDGKRVFAIQDSGFVGNQGYPPRNGIRGGFSSRYSLQGESNRLSAFELRTEGKLLWEIGGAESEIAELQDAFFLGPPLALSGALHALVEIRGGIRLVVLKPQTDSATGRETVELVWSQQLADVEETIMRGSVRQLAGATPSFADGVLVCPTSAGAVVAVDLARRSLLWAYKYPPRSGDNVRRRFVPQLAKPNDRWVDATATLVDGRVILTPVESDEIHCLDLTDGTLLWKQKRGENLYVAQVHDGKVVLVGPRSMTALKLADGGEPAWSPTQMTLPDRSMPSGRGYSSGNHYYLPLSSAEVAKIDVNDGRIVDRAISRDGIVPGNLICFRDEVVSLGAESLDTFFQIEPLRERVTAVLLDDPNDAEALARMGEIEFDRGNLTAAIDNFRHSFELVPNSLTRELLVQSLLLALQSDFAANQDAAEQLESLIDQPEQRVMLLRLIAEGQQKSYQHLEAFESYLKLVNLELGDSELFVINSKLSVRNDRYIQAQFVALRQAASPDERAVMDQEIEARLAALGERASVGELYRFLSHFGGNPAADVARRSLALQLLEGDSPLECEMLLGQLARSSDAEHRRAATAMMAELLRSAGRPKHAAMYYSRLASEFSQDVSLRGKTGEEIFADLPEDDPVRNAMGDRLGWPTGKVTATKPAERAVEQRNRRQFVEVALRGDRGPFFSQTFISLDQRTPLIVGRDGLGKVDFRSTLHGQRMPKVNSNSNYFYGLASGHLLLISLGDQVVALDTLGSAGEQRDRVLWQEDVVGKIPGTQFGSQPVSGKKNKVPGGRPRFRAVDSKERTVGVLGPITQNGVAFQSQGNLKCVDPLTGALLWTRTDIPSGSELFGDDELLLVIPPDALEAQVYRMRDGTSLGSCQVPPESERMAFLGRRILQASTPPLQRNYELKLIDPWKNVDIWSRSFASRPRTWMVDDDVIGTMETSGKFVLLSLADGQALIDELLEPEPSLGAIYLMRSSDQYLLITNGQAPPRSNNRRVLPASRNPSTPLVSGHVYAFDRQTLKPMWPVPATISQRSLSLSQPRELPVLTFVQHFVPNNNQRQRKRKTSVLCLDKRTGRKLYATELTIANGPYRLLGDKAEKTVSFVTASSAFKLKFSDEPTAPAPPYQGHLERSESPRKTWKIFDIFGEAPQPGQAAERARRARRPDGVKKQ